jgi:hypothetical protein
MLGVQLSGAVATGTGAGVAQLRALSDVCRSDLWNRWVAQAQRRALIWWRDRRVCPGLAARFTTPGIAYYGFGRRLRKPSLQPPYYVVSGRLERALLARRPKTTQASRNAGVVVTRLAYGGGVLNFLDRPNTRPVTGWTRQTTDRSESYSVSSYTRATRGGSITVAGYAMQRTRTTTRVTPQRGGLTYAAAFGSFVKDRAAIEARVAVELRRIVRASALTKTGDIRQAVLADRQGAA